MMNFSEVRSTLESLADVVKKAATLDLQEKIVELREYIVSLKDDNISLKEANQTLKTQIEAFQSLVFKNGLYWLEGDSIPFCQKCFEDSHKPIHLQVWAGGWKCLVCEKFYPPASSAGIAQRYPKNLNHPSNSSR